MNTNTDVYFIENDLKFAPWVVYKLGASLVIDKDIEWSDLIFVIEDEQGARVAVNYRHLNLPPISILHIEDEYEFLDNELIELLTERINASLKVEGHI